MADRYVEIETNAGEVIVRLSQAERRIRRRYHDMVDDTAETGAVYLHLYSPTWTGYLKRHISHTKVHWTPGGAGGGGAWTAITGVKRGESFHPVYALMGTGIYVNRGLIVPKEWGQRPENEKVFSQMFRREFGRWGGGRHRKLPALSYRLRSGRPMASLYVRGQKPKPFLYLTFQATEAYLKSRVMTFGRDLF